MFAYFGRKLRLGPLYPPPKYDLVIEPFAGSMAYTLLHKPPQAIGIEANPLVVETWHRICTLSEQEILDYPLPEVGEQCHDHWLIQAAHSEHASTAVTRQWTTRMNRDAQSQKRYAARHLPYATTIDYRLGHYLDAPDVEATWFVDPPYQHVRQGYLRHSLDYNELSDFCKSRKGQVIVCEQEGADWLPFEFLSEIKGTVNKRSNEVVWIK